MVGRLDEIICTRCSLGSALPGTHPVMFDVTIAVIVWVAHLGRTGLPDGASVRPRGNEGCRSALPMSSFQRNSAAWEGFAVHKVNLCKRCTHLMD